MSPSNFARVGVTSAAALSIRARIGLGEVDGDGVHVGLGACKWDSGVESRQNLEVMGAALC